MTWRSARDKFASCGLSDTGETTLCELSKSKLKGCAGTVVQLGPEPSAVTFNNRTTDR
jgi:hypothetical protein